MKKTMKTLRFKKRTIEMLVVAVMALVACNNADYQVRNNSIYIVEAASTAKSAYLAFGEDGADVNLTVRLEKIVDHDVEATIDIDPDALAAYNEANGATYYSVEAANTDLATDNKIVIKAGEIAAVKKIHINNFDTEDKLWAFPVKVSSRNDVTPPSPAQSRFVYIVAEKIFAPMPEFKYLNAGDGIKSVTAHPTKDENNGWGLYLDEYTIEFWCRFDGYNVNNQAVLSVYGDDGTGNDYGIYVRFGDANTGDDMVNGRYNYFQWKAWDTQLEGPKELIKNQWYHWALVYDGANQLVYRNGEEYLRLRSQHAGEKWLISTFDMIACHVNYVNTCNLCQVRLWRKALSPTQIKNNMYYKVDAHSPGLEAYWKMDEGPDNFNNVFHDATGNGHDADVPVNGMFLGWTEAMGVE
jgi:hypothetical protein